ncbi:MAG: NYN domain-containing protein [Chloroflexi bacterium]|nr:NYN domain-containing protein [Chloroflexota bacterium]
MTTNVYIDGFNLYYGALRNSPFKWLDVRKMCETLLPRRRINKIRYFTARVNALPHDLQAPARQDVYLRALNTIPNVTIFEGRFVSRPAWIPIHPLSYPDPTKPPQAIQVLRTEEKGSDVNLATMLLVDCFDNDFDEAVVVSNDSDLKLPIEIVVTKFNKPAGVINPHPKGRISGDLIKVASFHLRTINRKVLADSQFPRIMTDAQGPFTKPASW